VTEPTPTIHVVDDDASLRKAVVRLLRAAGYEVCDYASAAEFLLARAESSPGCVVLDIRMPGLNGLELQEGINGRAGALPIIFLTGHGDIPMSVRAMKAGAVDFLTKPVQRDALLCAVRSALAQDAERRAIHDNLHTIRTRYESLTSRERDVFALVVAGKLNKNIATELAISERTVKMHRAQVMAKLHVTSVAALVRFAGQLKAVVPS
jgi:FixJ family two-component response regulator